MTATARHLVIVTPVHNDWECLSILAAQLARVLGAAGIDYCVIAVDDASEVAESAPVDTILRLTRNVGHQRAIAVGLDYAMRETEGDMIAIMDADGEDRPEDLPALMAALEASGGEVVVARRRRRSEGRRFRLFYAAYKIAFRILAGETLDFGNFCVLRRKAAHRLVSMHEMWLNLPATIMRSKLRTTRVPTDRGTRYAGQSRMNLVALVTHGLSAIGVFNERALTRMLLAIGGVALFMVASLITGLLLKLAGLATPGWVTTVAAAALIVLIQTATVATCGLFLVFSQAANLTQVPAAHAMQLISRVDRIGG